MASGFYDEPGFLERDMRILVRAHAGGEEADNNSVVVIHAHYDVLRLFSKAARSVPASIVHCTEDIDNASDDVDGLLDVTLTWDLRALDGATLPVVRSWLDAVYARACGEESARGMYMVVGAGGDADEDVKEPGDLGRLLRLLRFADAVRTSPAVIGDMVRAVAGPDADPILRLSPRVFFRLRGELHRHTHATIQVYDADSTELIRTMTPDAASGDGDVRAVADALCAQLEEALYQSARMGLRSLLGLAMAFVQANASMCFAAYSARVMSVLPKDVVTRGFLAQSLGGPYHAEMALPHALGGLSV